MMSTTITHHHAAPLPKIALITGSVPPNPCGVGDYTDLLLHSLRKSGVQTERFVLGSSAVSDLYSERIQEYNADIVHIQYPTVGFGKGFSAHFAMLANRGSTVLTLHEYSQAHFLRKLACIGLIKLADGLIFTNTHEWQACSQWSSPTQLQTIIPIGSNIPQATSLVAKKSYRDPKAIAYFGLIRPNKGIEEVIALAKILHDSSSDHHIIIIGDTPDTCTDYQTSLHSEADNLPIQWISGLNPEQVAQHLSACKWGYLPFPDGVSERRGSLLAMLNNGVHVVSTDGAQTSKSMRELV